MNNRRSLKKTGVALAGVAIVMGSIGAFGVAAGASSPHYGQKLTNNGCSWDGYHKHTTNGNKTADTEKKGGSCAEVHVRLFVDSGLVSQDWDSTKAVSSHNGWGSLTRSDHNADPVGPPPYMGYPLY